MIFKRFSLQRKKPELCNVCEQEMLKSNSSVKTKIFETLFWNIYKRIPWNKPISGAMSASRKLKLLESD